MKYLKTYENNTSVPKEGDYVIIKVYSHSCSKDSISFIESHVGKIKEISNSIVPYHIEFDQYYTYTNSLGEKCESNGYHTKRYEIEYFSPNKEDAETLLLAKKYNIL